MAKILQKSTKLKMRAAGHAEKLIMSLPGVLIYFRPLGVGGKPNRVRKRDRAASRNAGSRERKRNSGWASHLLKSTN